MTSRGMIDWANLFWYSDPLSSSILDHAIQGIWKMREDVAFVCNVFCHWLRPQYVDEKSEILHCLL